MISFQDKQEGDRLRARLRWRFFGVLFFSLLAQTLVVLFCPIDFLWAVVALLLSFWLLYTYGRMLKVCAAFYRPRMERALSTSFEKFTVGDSGAFAQYNIDNAGLAQTGGDAYRCVEPFSGRWRDVPFSWGAIRFDNDYPSPRGQVTFTRHCGTWLIFPRPVTFSHPILIMTRKRAVTHPDATGDLQRVEMPRGEFSKQFIVYSSSAHAAHYMLDETLQKRFLALRAASSGPMLMGFQGRTLHLAVYQSPKSLNIPLFGSIDPYLSAYHNERVHWPQQVVETLWPGTKAHRAAG